MEWRKKNLLVDKIPLPMMMKKRIILMMMLKSDVDHDEDGQDHHDHGGEKGGERKAQMRWHLKITKSSNLFGILNLSQFFLVNNDVRKGLFGIENHGKFVKGLWQTTLYWCQSKKRE